MSGPQSDWTYTRNYEEMDLAPNRQFDYWPAFLAVFLIVLFANGEALSQSISPNVKSSFGIDSQVETRMFSFSAGEAAVSTIGSGQYIITQGYLQPHQMAPCIGFELAYYPNPVRESITLLDSECGAMVARIELFDLFGRRVMIQELKNRSADLSDLVRGVFVARALSETNQPVGSFKIIKVTD